MHSKVARITCLIFKLWNYIQRIIYKTLHTVNDLLRAKYRKKLKERHSRIIVHLEMDDVVLRSSIRESGIRKTRRNVKKIINVEEREIQQETPLLQPNQRGRPSRQ